MESFIKVERMYLVIIPSYAPILNQDFGKILCENNWSASLFFCSDFLLVTSEADPGSGAFFDLGIRDPRWKKFGSGIKIQDPQHCSLP